MHRPDASLAPPGGWRDRSMLSCWPRGPRSSRLLIRLPVLSIKRSDPALVSFVVSFSYVRNRSACPTEDGQPRSRTAANYAVPSRADLGSVWGTRVAHDRFASDRVTK